MTALRQLDPFAHTIRLAPRRRRRRFTIRPASIRLSNRLWNTQNG